MNELEDRVRAIPFRALLNLWMCSDPWPASENDKILFEQWLENEAAERGYKDGAVGAYHYEPESGGI